MKTSKIYVWYIVFIFYHKFRSLLQIKIYQKGCIFSCVFFYYFKFTPIFYFLHPVSHIGGLSCSSFLQGDLQPEDFYHKVNLCEQKNFISQHRKKDSGEFCLEIVAEGLLKLKDLENQVRAHNYELIRGSSHCKEYFFSLYTHSLYKNCHKIYVKMYIYNQFHHH